MESFAALAMGQANRGKPLRTFDWNRAAELIRERQPESASAGLQSDWEYTGGDIYEDGRPVIGSSFLSSTWAVPEIDMDGDVQECWVMQEGSGWHSDTKWPTSALCVLYGAPSLLDNEILADWLEEQGRSEDAFFIRGFNREDD